MKAKFPPYKGEWGQEHIDWFIQNSHRLIHKKTGLISACIVQQIASPKKGEPNITPQKARELMQLIVVNKSARVTDGFVDITEYRIKMCSPVDCFHYLDELFSHELLFRLSVADLLPSRDKLCEFLEMPTKDWTKENESIYLFEKKRIGFIICYFFRYAFKGGDFGDLPPFFNSTESKRQFVLDANLFICLYKAVKIGWEELDENGVQSADDLFVLLLSATAACRFLREFKKYRSAPIKPTTMSKEIQKIARELEPGICQNFPAQRTIFVMGDDYAHADDLVVKVCGFASGGRFMDQLARSTNPEIKSVVDNYWLAAIAVLKFKKG
jgi:hypothetical protein